MDGNGIKEQLSDKQLRVIPHLLAAPSIEEGCKQAKVGKAPVYEWLKNETFRDELRRHRQEIVTTLKANITSATEALVGLLDSQNESIKHRTDRDVIEFVVKTTENESMEERIEALEEQLKELNEGRR